MNSPDSVIRCKDTNVPQGGKTGLVIYNQLAANRVIPKGKAVEFIYVEKLFLQVEKKFVILQRIS